MKQHTDVGMYFIAGCCWPPQNDNECHPPGLPIGWQAPGGDPAGVSNNEYLGAVQILTV